MNEYGAAWVHGVTHLRLSCADTFIHCTLLHMSLGTCQRSGSGEFWLIQNH